MSETKTKSVIMQPVQYKQITSLCRKYPDSWGNESHFIRCAVNFFINQIKNGKFKVNEYE